MTTKTSKKTEAGAEAFGEAGQEAAANFFSAGSHAYEKLFADTKAQFDKAVISYDDVAEFSNENLKAMVAAQSAYAKGVEILSADWFAFSKRLAEENVVAAKSVFAATTVNEAVDLQGAFVKKSVDAVLSQSAKSGEMAAKVTKDAVEPINARVTAVVEKLSTFAA